jgi:hypothetical protein
MSHPAQAVPREPVLERLGLGTSSYVELARRLAIVGLVATVLCAASFALVESIATTPNVRRGDRADVRGPGGGPARGRERGQERGDGSRRARWSTPELARAPGEILLQLVIIGVAAFAGRKVLRLRL